MNPIEPIKIWIGDPSSGPGPKPTLSVEEAMAAHQAAVAARDAAEAEEAAAEAVHEEKLYALGRAKETESRAAALLVEASAKSAGASRDVVVQDSPKRRAVADAVVDAIGRHFPTS